MTRLQRETNLRDTGAYTDYTVCDTRERMDGYCATREKRLLKRKELNRNCSKSDLQLIKASNSN